MNFIDLIRHVFWRNGSDQQVAVMKADLLKKTQELSRNASKVNKILYTKSTTYYIAKAMGLKGVI